ncbi:hypothetical protein MASR1M59_22460 [Melaminivora sp.]
MTILSQRRHWLQQCAAGLAAWPLAAAQAQGSSKAAERPILVAQLADMSPSQQDVSRDFLVGSRAAWQSLNARGGIHGQPVQHWVIEVQGQGQALRQAWQEVQAQPACVALSGCVGDGLAAALASLQNQAGAASTLAQSAPWLHSQDSPSERVFPVFSGYQAQIIHALKSLASMGVRELGVVYASQAMLQQSQHWVRQAAQSLGLSLHALPIPGSQPQAERQLAAPAQALLLFIGGTPELHSFTGRLRLPPGRHCYIVALADVNLQVLAQMGAMARNVSVIATQSVPSVSASLPIVRAYREALARLYDEPPSPQGLAGFIAARYTAQLLQGLNGPITRASVLAALRRRPAIDLGGFAIEADGPSPAYVTQSMLAADGRIVG